jgi:glycyl-tRNA synthetase (class II)
MKRVLLSSDQLFFLRAMPATSLDQVVSLAKRRGFVFPGSEIYGGLANSWDYGPHGTTLKNAIRDWWWERFVQKRQDMVGLDAAIMMNPKVWQASGHNGRLQALQGAPPRRPLDRGGAAGYQG